MENNTFLCQPVRIQGFWRELRFTVISWTWESELAQFSWSLRLGIKLQDQAHWLLLLNFKVEIFIILITGYCYFLNPLENFQESWPWNSCLQTAHYVPHRGIMLPAGIPFLLLNPVKLCPRASACFVFLLPFLIFNRVPNTDITLQSKTWCFFPLLFWIHS